MMRHDDLRGRLFGLLIRLRDRFGDSDRRLLHEFIDAGEFGLALEQMADVLAESGTPITDGERGEMLVLIQVMAMDDRVPRVLRLCPRAD